MTSKRPSVKRTLTLRQKIRDNLTFEYANETLAGDRFEAFVEDFLKQLPGKPNKDFLWESLKTVLSVELTAALLSEVAWRIAGNIDLLKTQAVLPWIRQVTDEKVPVQVLSARRDRPGRRPGWTFKLQVLAGTSCPMVLTKFWPEKFCRFLSSRLGFGYLSSKYPLYSPREFTSLRFALAIERKLSLERPGFDQIEEWPSLIAHNRKVMKMRKRMDGFRCPANFKKPCHLCHYGYDNCPAAVHAITYVFKDCPSCENRSAYDPGLNSPVCLACFERTAVQGD